MHRRLNSLDRVATALIVGLSTVPVVGALLMLLPNRFL